MANMLQKISNSPDYKHMTCEQALADIKCVSLICLHFFFLPSFTHVLFCPVHVQEHPPICFMTREKALADIKCVSLICFHVFFLPSFTHVLFCPVHVQEQRISLFIPQIGHRHTISTSIAAECKNTGLSIFIPLIGHRHTISSSIAA